MDVTWTTGRITRDGEDLYYEHSWPDGDDVPAVVLTHGAGGTHAAWFQQVPALVDAGYQVLTWDSRGFGNSTNRGTLTTEAVAADLEALMDHVGIAAAHLVGQSMGGWYVTELALRHPERARSLSLCDTAGGLFTDELRRAMADFAARGGLNSAPPTVGRHAAVNTPDRTLAFLYQQLNTFHAPPLAEVGKLLAGTVHAHGDVEALGIPVMVLAGDGDPIFPAPLLKDMAGLVRGSRYVEIADAGHSPYFEQAAAFNEALLDFLASAEAGRP